MQKNTGKRVVALKEETRNTLKEIQENKFKQVKDFNIMFQVLKKVLKTIKKLQIEKVLEIEKPGKRSEATDVSMTNIIEQMDEKISGIEDIIEDIDT